MIESLHLRMMKPESVWTFIVFTGGVFIGWEWDETGNVLDYGLCDPLPRNSA